MGEAVLALLPLRSALARSRRRKRAVEPVLVVPTRAFEMLLDARQDRQRRRTGFREHDVVRHFVAGFRFAEVAGGLGLHRKVLKF